MKHLRILSVLLIIATLLTSVGFAGGKTAYVTCGDVGVYEKANLSSKCIYRLGFGAPVTVEATSGEWAKISADGHKGYCKNYVLSTKNPCTINQKTTASKDIRVYALPKKDAKYTTTKAGTSITVEGKIDSWYRVKRNGSVGYVKTSDLSLSSSKSSSSSSSSSSTSSSSSKTSTKTYYVGSCTVGVYNKPSSSAKCITTLGYGTKLTVTGSSGSWTEIKNGSSVGYCKTSCLSTKDPNTLKTTLYASKDTKLYTLPDSGAKATSIKANTKMTATAKFNKWYRVSYNNSVYYILQSDASTKTVTVSTEKKVSKTSYVCNSTAKVYASASTSSSVKATVVYGAKCTVSATDGSFSKITSGSTTGYIKTSALTDKNPNTLNKKVYPQSKTITVYNYPSTSAGKASVSYSTALTATAQYDSNWLRVTYDGKVAFVKSGDVGTRKFDGVSTSKPASGKSKTMDWFKSNIRSIFAKGTVATVTDVKTGISWKVKRTGGTNHADVQPCSAADTAAMKKACGSDFGTWNRRAIWVSIGGQKYAASMNCMPHGNNTISGNNFDGHHCIHFTNSRTHASDKVDPAHQAAIKRAAAAG